ncbi:MAG: hypothetical protein KAV42_03710 [Candidatus Krumholzibacteria bacterium]|nr:hypothetical protein [Candidatus Krumholzibacteria bacterium]
MRECRNKTVLFIIAVAMLPLLPYGLSATEGSRGGTFLPMGWDARGEALGGAATLLARDDGAAYYNPANLVFLRSTRVTAGVTRPVPGLDNLYSIVTAGTGLMDTRTSPDGTVEVRRLAAAVSISHLGLKLAGGSAWNEGTAGFSAAFSINHFNSIGATVRFLRSWTDLDDADSWGMAFDFGWTTRLYRNLWFGLVARNTNSVIHYPEIDEELDSSVNLALSLEELFGRVSIEGDVVTRAGELNRILLGSEIVIVEGTLSILGGVDARLVNYSRTITSFGLLTSLANADIALSFTFDPEDAFGRQTRLSVSYQF